MSSVMIILSINVYLTVTIDAAFTRVNQQRQFSLKQTVT